MESNLIKILNLLINGSEREENWPVGQEEDWISN